ncbi:MAG: DUF389 domain-containing protein [Acidobacteria bacterium]|nr:DUF389 domain-containing protein [Acidobacteriota bacterium]
MAAHAAGVADDVVVEHPRDSPAVLDGVLGEDAPAEEPLLLPRQRRIDDRGVEAVLEELEALGEIDITLNPRGIIALYPPVEEAPDQVIDVEIRSPLEIFLAGLQSIGSWRSFLAYVAAAGMIVWIGFFTNTIFLLIAAMLIAPYAGPAMNLAIGTARGDTKLVRRSLLRYFAALAVSMAVAAVMTFVLRQEIPTVLMIDVSNVSSVAFILPLVAGAAGAMNLLQSDRSSLVSGAAVGMLVAASIAPPVGLVGMATVLGEWDMAGNGLFLLILQLVAINLSGALVFRLAGLSSSGARYNRGRRSVSIASLGLSALILSGMLAIQFREEPTLVRSSEARRAAAEITQAVNSTGVAKVVEANVRFTRAEVEGQNSLLCVIYVQPTGARHSEQEIRRVVERAVSGSLTATNFTPLLSVELVEPWTD